MSKTEYKMFHKDEMTIFHSLEEVSIAVNTICSRDSSIRKSEVYVTKVRPTGQEIIIFKSAQYLPGNEVYVTRKKSTRVPCENCATSGVAGGKNNTINGETIGPCKHCRGKGYLDKYEKDEMICTGPFTVVESNNTDIKLKDHLPETVPMVDCHADKRIALRYAQEYNTIVTAKKKAANFGQ
jgi:hypothetical protein